MARSRDEISAELRELAKTKVLTGVHGRLPKGVIPVPCVDLSNRCPVAWKKVFSKYKASGKVWDWHGIMEEYRGGSVLQAIEAWPDTKRTDVRKFFLCLQDEIDQILRKTLSRSPEHRQIRDRVCGDTSSLFTILFVWMLLDRPEKDFFANLLYQCYCAGGVPCGWLGQFPKGNLIVYWPYDQEPQFE